MHRDKVYWFKTFKSFKPFKSFDVSFILPASAGGRNEVGDEVSQLNRLNVLNFNKDP
jgi:hypothetical protein